VVHRFRRVNRLRNSSVAHSGHLPRPEHVRFPREYIDEVDLDDGELVARAVTYAFGELDTLVPAYAATIHKSQGSEYPAVVIPVMTQHYAMLQRNLLYTGVTRGKKLVVLVGQKKAVAIAVRNVSGRRRWSKLNEWLRGAGQRPGSQTYLSIFHLGSGHQPPIKD
jgi:UvrD-like helicase C-terminal domain